MAGFANVSNNHFSLSTFNFKITTGKPLYSAAGLTDCSLQYSRDDRINHFKYPRP